MSRYIDISHFRAPYKAATLQGLGAPAVQLWYYDENKAGKVRCFVPAAAQLIFATLAGTNQAVTGPLTQPTAAVWALPLPASIPGMDGAMLVVLPVAVAPPEGAVRALQWLEARKGAAVALFSKTPGAPLDVSVAGFQAGEFGLMASGTPQMVAGEAQPLSSAVFSGYTPVLSGGVPGGGGGGGGGGGEQPTKAGIGPLGVATIAVVIGAIGYLALRKK